MANNNRKISKLTLVDQKMLHVLSCVGYATKEELVELSGIKPSKIDKFANKYNQLLEKTQIEDPRTKELITLYYAADKVKPLVREQCPERIPCWYRGKDLHDRGVMKIFRACNKYEREHWIRESQVREMIRDRITNEPSADRRNHLIELERTKAISPTDGAYYTTSEDGEVELVLCESITDSYKPRDIQAKLRTVKLLNAQYHQDIP